MPSISQFVSSLKKIKRSNDVYASKEVLSAYIKLSLKKSTINNNLKKNVPGNYQLLDFNVSYLSFATMAILFDEIFVGLEYCFKTDKDQPFIIDCGSNMGMSILFYKYLYPEAEVIGFEADKLTYDVLENNVLKNNLNNTTVYNKAVMDHDGTISFYHDPDNIGALHMSVLQERESKSKTEVECVTLDKFIDKPVDFLKMDIEGAESSVIRDLYEKDKLKFINQMVIEYHLHIKKDEDNLSELLQQLETSNFGYQFCVKYDTPYKAKEFQDIIIYAYKK